MKSRRWAWHVHHDTLVELVIPSLKDRVVWIKENKDPNEKPLRLKLLRYVKGEVRLRRLIRKCARVPRRIAIRRLHRRECVPWCPWNGRTIFSQGYNMRQIIKNWKARQKGKKK